MSYASLVLNENANPKQIAERLARSTALVIPEGRGERQSH